MVQYIQQEDRAIMTSAHTSETRTEDKELAIRPLGQPGDLGWA